MHHVVGVGLQSHEGLVRVGYGGEEAVAFSSLRLQPVAVVLVFPSKGKPDLLASVECLEDPAVGS